MPRAAAVMRREIVAKLEDFMVVEVVLGLFVVVVGVVCSETVVVRRCVLCCPVRFVDRTICCLLM